MAFEDRKYMTGAQTGTRAAAAIDEGLRSHMLRVYNYMASGVLLTGIVAYLIANTTLSGLFYAPNAQGYMTPTILTWISFAVSFGMVFFLSARLDRMASGTARAVFWAYAGLMGIWLSSILMTYTGVSVARIFFITTIAFGSLSLYGYTTKKSLSGWGTFLMMGVIGILIAFVVNIFLQSPMLMFVASAIGVLVFAGLTAYDTQKIKTMYLESDSAETASKKAILGALTLYMDFINMFIMLMMLFGQRD